MQRYFDRKDKTISNYITLNFTTRRLKKNSEPIQVDKIN
jgi:hypothetical protein